MINVIVAIDGNVNTGKTQLFNRLKSIHNKCSYSDEYKEVIHEDNLEREIMYLKQDEKRTFFNKDIILDRSVLSLFAYVYWLFESKKDDIRCEFYSYVINGILDKKYVLPNRIIYCYQDYNHILKSYNLNNNIKGTEKTLVSKEYYEIQNDFYSRLIEQLHEKVLKYNYLLDSCDIDIYNEENHIEVYELLNALRYTLKINDVNRINSINGTSSIGKSTLCNIFKRNQCKIIEEVRFVNKSKCKDSELNHQVNFYKKSINRYLNKGNIVIDNGIFENISYTFFLAASRGYGIDFIDDYFNEIKSIYSYININQTFYLIASDKELIMRQIGDSSKVRKHFESNISFRASEMKFAEMLSNIIPNKLFVLISTNKTIEEIYKECIISSNFCTISIKDFLNIIYNNRYEIYQYYIKEK